jgi:hypothetical protein
MARGARGLLLAVTLAAATMAVTATGVRAEQRCHDFNRFGERWELCVNPDGSAETHRLGVRARP